jgi:nicotinamide-nucleotide amidase
MVGVEIISIGDELLIGQVVNTNASWMAQELNNSGIRVNQVTTIGDDKDQILSTLSEAGRRSDIILMTGGLGPTRDDITKETLCTFFNSRLVFNQQVYNQIETLFKLRGYDLNMLNRDQAEIPGNCTPIANPHGTAAGMWFEKENKIYISMPGVPFEMQPMLTDYVIPEILRRFPAGAIVHKTFLTQGVPESILAQQIEAWEENIPANIKLAYLPQPGMVRLRLSAFGIDRAILQKQIDAESEKLNALIPEVVFGYDEDTLEAIVGMLLTEKKKTLSTAESCTGGYMAHLITSVPGSSAYFRGSVVAYANDIKEHFLVVHPDTLKEFGAVSKQVVMEMAHGIRKQFATDYAIAVSGIAGPDGGTSEKPVGTTWIALATPEQIITHVYQFGENRQRNIRKAALASLGLLWKEIKRAEGSNG